MRARSEILIRGFLNPGATPERRGWLLPARRIGSVAFCTALLLLLAAANPARAGKPKVRWTASWAASQQRVEPYNSLPATDMHDATVRQIIHLSIGGAEIRLHLSNRFGRGPLRLTGVHVARPVSNRSDQIVAGTDKALTFSGSPDVIIPEGAEYFSDPIPFAVSPLSDLAITLHIDYAPDEQTGHPGSRATTYAVQGDATSAAELSGAQTLEHWYYIAGVDVEAPQNSAAIVALGDSITDGHASTTNGNDRWTDVLARRLQGSKDTKDISVLNEGIGGNHLLTDGIGPNALARFDQDVIAQAGVRYLIVFEAINDIGRISRMGDVPAAEHQMLVRRVIGAYEQMIARAHAHGIRAIGATITPFAGSGYYHPASASEADRQAINDWIRAPGHFDAVLDFDQAVRDPRHLDRMLPQFDCGDHLHPSPAGYAAIGESIPLSLFSSKHWRAAP